MAEKSKVRQKNDFLSVVVNFESLRFMILVEENYLISDLIKEIEKTYSKLCCAKVTIKTLKNSVNAVLPDWYPVAPLIKNGDEIYAFTDAAADVLNLNICKSPSLLFSRNVINGAKSTCSSTGKCDSGFTSHHGLKPFEKNFDGLSQQKMNEKTEEITKDTISPGFITTEEHDNMSAADEDISKLSDSFSLHPDYCETVSEENDDTKASKSKRKAETNSGITENNMSDGGGDFAVPEPKRKKSGKTQNSKKQAVDTSGKKAGTSNSEKSARSSVKMAANDAVPDSRSTGKFPHKQTDQMKVANQKLPKNKKSAESHKSDNKDVEVISGGSLSNMETGKSRNKGMDKSEVNKQNLSNVSIKSTELKKRRDSTSSSDSDDSSWTSDNDKNEKGKTIDKKSTTNAAIKQTSNLKRKLKVKGNATGKVGMSSEIPTVKPGTTSAKELEDCSDSSDNEDVAKEKKLDLKEDPKGKKNNTAKLKKFSNNQTAKPRTVGAEKQGEFSNSSDDGDAVTGKKSNLKEDSKGKKNMSEKPNRSTNNRTVKSKTVAENKQEGSGDSSDEEEAAMKGKKSGLKADSKGKGNIRSGTRKSADDPTAQSIAVSANKPEGSSDSSGEEDQGPVDVKTPKENMSNLGAQGDMDSGSDDDLMIENLLAPELDNKRSQRKKAGEVDEDSDEDTSEDNKTSRGRSVQKDSKGTKNTNDRKSKQLLNDGTNIEGNIQATTKKTTKKDDSDTSSCSSERLYTDLLGVSKKGEEKFSEKPEIDVPGNNLEKLIIINCKMSGQNDTHTSEESSLDSDYESSWTGSDTRDIPKKTKMDGEDDRKQPNKTASKESINNKKKVPTIVDKSKSKKNVGKPGKNAEEKDSTSTNKKLLTQRATKTDNRKTTTEAVKKTNKSDSKTSDDSSTTAKRPFTQLPAKNSAKLENPCGNNDHKSDNDTDSTISNDNKKFKKNEELTVPTTPSRKAGKEIASSKEVPKTPKTPKRQKDPKPSPHPPESPETPRSRRSAVDKSTSKVASWLLANDVSLEEAGQDGEKTVSDVDNRPIMTRSQKSNRRGKNKSQQSEKEPKEAEQVSKEKTETKTEEKNAIENENGGEKTTEITKTEGQNQKRKLDETNGKEQADQAIQSPGKNGRRKRRKRKQTGKNEPSNVPERRKEAEETDKTDAGATIQQSQNSSKQKATPVSLPKKSRGLSALFEDDKTDIKNPLPKKKPKATAWWLEESKPTGFLTPKTPERKSTELRSGKQRKKKVLSSQPSHATELNVMEKELLSSGGLNLDTLLNDETIRW